MRKMSRFAAATSVALLALSSVVGARSSCQIIGGHIHGQLGAPTTDCPFGTETGTFTGSGGGTFLACVVDIKEHGGGVLVFRLVHTYTLSNGDTFTTADNIVAHPIQGSVYQVENHATVTGGTGAYEDAVGFIYDEGTVDLSTGAVSVDYQGRICTP
jgi:hypothetical protein